AVRGEQLAQPGLLDGKPALGELAATLGVGVVGHHLEALRGAREAVDDPEVREPGEADRHRATPTFAAASIKTELIQMSVSMLVSGRPQRALKCAYSLSQVGSAQRRVFACSSGRPLGRTRLRSVKVLGPHLQRLSTWALPRSPITSARKLLRH